jgi:hypothetical protein
MAQMPENVRIALELHNKAAEIAKSGMLKQAIDKWQAAITFNPPLGLETMIQHHLLRACFMQVINLPEGSHLTQEQAEYFLIGEQALSRLLSLCKDEAPEGPTVNLDEKVRSQCLAFAEECRNIDWRSFTGWYILPGIETPKRMSSYGMWLADKDETKKDAIVPLRSSLALLNINDPEQKIMARDISCRLAFLYRYFKQNAEAAKHARQAIILGIKDRQDNAFALLTAIIIAAGDKPPKI